MALVSGLYRMAPSEWAGDRREGQRRLKVRLRRLVAAHGREEVVRRIRAWPVPERDAVVKAWLVLEAEAMVEGQRGASA